MLTPGNITWAGYTSVSVSCPSPGEARGPVPPPAGRIPVTGRAIRAGPG